MIGLYIGSYYNGENDIVKVMARSLSESIELVTHDPKIYTLQNTLPIEKTKKYNRHIFTLSELLKLVKSKRPNFLILNSGGLYLEDKAIQYCKEQKIVTIGISLSDPDVYEDHGQFYAHKFDLFYSNSPYSIKNQYLLNHQRAHLLTFAGDSEIFFPIQNIEKPYDLIIVGHRRVDRILPVLALKNKFKIGLFGKGWGNSHKPVYGLDQVKALNMGKMYLSFSGTRAGFKNVKIGLFEAAACKLALITELNDDINSFFKVGSEVQCYNSISELMDLVKYNLNNPHRIEWLASNAYKRFLNDHTWKKRWQNVISDIIKIRKELNYE